MPSTDFIAWIGRIQVTWVCWCVFVIGVERCWCTEVLLQGALYKSVSLQKNWIKWSRNKQYLKWLKFDNLNCILPWHSPLAFRNGSHAIPVQIGMVFTKKIIQWNGKLVLYLSIWIESKSIVWGSACSIHTMLNLCFAISCYHCLFIAVSFSF